MDVETQQLLDYGKINWKKHLPELEGVVQVEINFWTFVHCKRSQNQSIDNVNDLIPSQRTLLLQQERSSLRRMTPKWQYPPKTCYVIEDILFLLEVFYYWTLVLK
jgi:hypothetical protein